MAVAGAPPGGGGANAEPRLQGDSAPPPAHRLPLPGPARADSSQQLSRLSRGCSPRGRSEPLLTNATGPLAGRRAGGRARPAARGLSGPSKRSSAIGCGDSRAERPARPRAGLPPACPDPRLYRGAEPEPGSRQVSAWWSRGGSRVMGLCGAGCGGQVWWGRGTAEQCRDCKEGPYPVLGTSWGGGSHPAGDQAR